MLNSLPPGEHSSLNGTSGGMLTYKRGREGFNHFASAALMPPDPPPRGVG